MNFESKEPQQDKYLEDLINLVRAIAIGRGSPIDRKYIVEALKRINSDQEDLIEYPTIYPYPEQIYDIAVEIKEKEVLRNKNPSNTT